MTDRPGVFAGGDAAAAGLYTAIEAVAAGRRAAAAIHNHPARRATLPVWEDEQDTARPSDEELAAIAIGQRVPMAMVDGLRAARRLARGLRGYDADEAVAEAERCLDCAVCATATRACAPARAAPSTETSASGPRRSPSAP